MNILCISPFFPPVRDSEAFCGGKMVLALQERGAEVKTLYLDAPYLDARQDASSLWRPLRERSTGLGRAPGTRLWAAFCHLRYLTPVWPRWIADVVTAAVDLHRRDPFQLVYSRSLPMFAHVAGYWASRRLGLPWIANINDPWDEHLFPGVDSTQAPRWHAALSHRWLRRTLTRASKVVFPNARLANYTCRLAGVQRDTEIMPHVGGSVGCVESAPGFVLVHAGKLGATEITGRSTRALMLGLRQFLNAEPGALSTTQLRLVGLQDEESGRLVAELNLDRNVCFTGQVSYEQSLREIGAASACVLIEAEMAEGIYLPSKLADYLSARKPVLALSPAAGVIADLASEPGVVRLDQRHSGRVAEALGHLFRDYLLNRLRRFRPSPELVNQFSGNRLAAQFLDMASALQGLAPAQAESGCRRSVIGTARPAV